MADLKIRKDHWPLFSIKNMIKVNLLALTGFGNEALKTLLRYKEKVKILALYTRKEKATFPYYNEEKIMHLAIRLGVKVNDVPLKGSWFIDDQADINLIVTLHRILKEIHLQKARYNINIHPSLLPSYRGPTPTNWMIYNKEKICGLTAHILTKSVDTGPIIFQRCYPLTVKTDSALRRYLASKVNEAVNYLIDNFPNYNIMESKFKESYCPSFYSYRSKKML